MKVLLLVTLVAAASSSASPGFAYHTGLPWYPYAVHAPLAVTYALPAGCTNNLGHLVPCALPAAEDSAVEEARKKREADPAVLATTTRVVSPVRTLLPYHGLGYLGAPAVYGLGYSHGFLGYGGYLGYPLGLHAVTPAATSEDGAVEEARKKREAEADPYYFYGHHGYAGYAGYGYGHGYAYAGWPYTYGHYTYAHHGCRNYLGALVPCA